MTLDIIHNENCLSGLKKLPSDSIDCCVTSPPYWALRDYGVDGQLGLEKTFQEYISNLCDIFDEVKRVLKHEGTCWANLGDTYWGGGRNSGNTTDNIYKQHTQPASFIEKQWDKTYKDKSLCQIPSRFAIEMVNRGWILRNEIIWHKPNCMPSSARDRFTVDFEKVFFFVKNKKYFFESQFEKATYTDNRANKGNIRYINRNTNCGVTVTEKRNKRCIWKINTKPFKEAHFAVMPEKLVRECLKAGCPEYVCLLCGKPREQIFEKTGNYIGMGGYGSKTAEHQGVSQSSALLTKQVAEKQLIGLSDCGCNAGFKSGIVLDPFMGAGTVGLVAKKMNMNYIGYELNLEYVKIAEKRIKPIKDQTNIFEVA